MITIKEALKSHQSLDSESALFDTELLLCHVIECNRTYLQTWPEKATLSASVTTQEKGAKQ